MARRRKSSTADDFIELVSMLPWWAGVSMAVVSYVILHALSAPAVAVATRPDQMAQMVTSSIWKTFAYAGQYLVPFFCVLGALVSALRRQKRTTLVRGVTSGSTASALEGVSWREFEMLVGEGYRLQGYSVVENQSAGPDGGVDLRLRKDGDRYLVQCKQWKSFKVGVQVVRELYGVMAAEGAAGGMVVTSGTFTAEAVAFSKGRNVQLVDGPALMLLLKRARQQRPADTSPPVIKEQVRATALTSPDCPLCSAQMKQRVAKRGPNAGNAFWGCSRYPGCKGVINAVMPRDQVQNVRSKVSA